MSFYSAKREEMEFQARKKRESRDQPVTNS